MTQRKPRNRDKDSIKRLKAIVEAGELLNSSLNLKKILTTLLDIATKNLNADRGTIYLLDKKKKELWSQVAKADKTMEIRLPLGKGIAGAVGKTGETVNVKDAYKDKRFFQGVDAQTGFRTRTMLCTPMKNKNGQIIGVFQILNKKRGYFDKQDEALLASLSIPASLAIENARLHLAEIENQRLERELEVAAEIQQQLLPSELPSVLGIQLSATSIPCRTVGGDFYEAIKISDTKIVLAIADVSGKGIPSALLVSTLQASLQAYLELDFSPVDLVSKLNKTIYENSTSEKFITFVLGIYDIPSRRLRYVNAGHNYPFIIHSSGGFSELNKGGVCLGLFPEATYEQDEVQLAPGDILIFYTDGVTETMNKRHDLFGEARLYSTLRNNSEKDVIGLQSGLLEEISSFAAGYPQADDITMILMKVSV